MQLSQTLAGLSVAFDDPNLVGSRGWFRCSGWLAAAGCTSRRLSC
jgi:hypothetical protein